MTYENAIEYINKNSENKIIPGLDNMKKLCALLGNPEKKIKTIHIAGTNGKGSVGTFIAEGLMQNGYNTGRYISPAVLDYRDKLTYNNKWISKKEFAETVAEVKSLIEKSDCKPTVFELETAIAFYWLNKKKCDFAVIETGMGGRLDATNVTDKIIAVITPISLDHTKFLGNTIEKITEEKAGIIKNTAVSANQQLSINEILKKHSKEIIFTAKANNITYNIEKTTFDYKNYENIEISMLGRFQVENACIAIETLEKIDNMGYEIKNIPNSIKNAQWNCRFQVISKNPLVIIDGAHNPHGALALRDNIDLYLKDKKIVYITGVLKDKNYDKIAEITAPYASKIFTIQSESSRALSAEEYSKVIYKYNKNVIACTAIKEAVKSALNYENILVFGSLSFMGEIYKIFKEELCTTE